MQFLRLIVFGFLGLSVVYICVSLYSRSVRLEKLEDEWDADPQGDDAARQRFLDEGMAAYRSGLRRQLIWLVYIIPTVLIGIIMYMVN